MENRHHDKYIMAELICTRTGDKGGLIKHYLCSLSGEDVGEIMWREIRPYAWQKPYTVYANYVDERTFGHSKFQRRSEIGNYDTLIECKRALLDPAKAYLEAKREAEAKKNRQNNFTPAAYLPAGESYAVRCGRQAPVRRGLAQGAHNLGTQRRPWRPS